MSRVLVTGGAGFIGSHVIDKLVASGHEPVIFDPEPSPWPEHAGVAQIRGSIMDPTQIAAAASGCDVIIHLAAAADVGLVAKDAAGSEALNSRGTLNVLEAARSLGARVLYASTIWVYSDTPGGLLDEDSPLLPPAHVYSATKLAGELYCRSYRELYDVKSTILRFGIPYGPRARPAAVLPIFVGKALAGEALTIAGDGSQTRRFVYVEDLADGVVAALTDRAVDRTYNLVGEQETSVRDIADAVCDAIGDVPIVHVEGRAGDFAGAVISGERARDELGWIPTTTFRDGTERYVAWHRVHDAERRSAAPARRVAMRRRLMRGNGSGRVAARLAHRVPLTVASIVLLVYLLALASVERRPDHLGTLIATSVMLLTAIDTRAVVPSSPGLVFGTIAGLVFLAVPQVARFADLAPLNASSVVLAAVGAVGALGCAAAAERAFRSETAEQRT
jgi:UDP-glucose 4-epimerase